ncbi:MAG: aldo/keto reductase, partial [Gammaproteobacteria bacterium]
MHQVRITRRDALKVGIAAAAGAAFARPAGALAQEIFDMPLITKPIPSTGERLPVIGIGTNAFGVESEEQLAPLRDVLARLPELGGKVVDTAHAYGRSEQVIGRLTEELGNRDRLFIATKTPIRGDVSDPEATLAKAFETLRTDVIDLMQIHNLHGTD